MEYCGGGTLRKHIEDRKKKGFSVMRIGGYIQQLADGLRFIHSRNVTHRDMKSENIMMTKVRNQFFAKWSCPSDALRRRSPASPNGEPIVRHFAPAPPPDPPDQSDHRRDKPNSLEGKSGRAIFGPHLLGS